MKILDFQLEFKFLDTVSRNGIKLKIKNIQSYHRLLKVVYDILMCFLSIALNPH